MERVRTSVVCARGAGRAPSVTSWSVTAGVRIMATVTTEHVSVSPAGMVATALSVSRLF